MLLTTNELLLIWLHLLHSHGVWLLEATVLLLLLHSVHASRLHLVRVLARLHLLWGTLAHDIALWIASDRLLSHFNIIVYYNSAKAFKKAGCEILSEKKYDSDRRVSEKENMINAGNY